MDKWEYRDVAINAHEFSELNKLGQQGWEAVGQTELGTILLKRKIPASPTQSEQKTKPAQTPNFDDDFGIRF